MAQEMKDIKRCVVSDSKGDDGGHLVAVIQNIIVDSNLNELLQGFPVLGSNEK